MSDSKGAAIREQIAEVIDREYIGISKELRLLIADEILAILAQEVKRVIGDDDEVPYDEGRFYQKVIARNELRAEQRKAGLV